MVERGKRLPLVTLYTRAGCHLCDDALALLRRLAPTLGFAIVEADVDADPELLARYDLAVPVVALDGVELARAPISAETLRRRLEAALAR